MSRVNGRLLVAALVVSFFTGSVLAGQGGNGDSDRPTVSVRPLLGPLYLLQGRGGNVVASVGRDGVLLVDDDYAELSGAYQQALDAVVGADTTPRFVLNTHWHSDHSGGNAHWGGRGAVIVAHHNVRERMGTRQEVGALDMVVEPSPREALPVVTYGTAMALHVNGTDIEVQHYPGGHTDGDSVVFFVQQNTLHTGDLFFKDRFPFVDVSTGGNAVTYMNNVALLLDRIDGDTLVIPGHGPASRKVDLERFHLMLERTIGMVRGALDQGQSVEQVIDQGLGPEWESWGRGFINEANWIRIVAASLEAAPGRK
jgi:glyoxylase-like metal-dependent hydrolase (beta-lactamase superfamily II)